MKEKRADRCMLATQQEEEEWCWLTGDGGAGVRVLCAV